MAVDAEATNVLGSLGRLVEKLRGRKIVEEERRNARVVVELLEAALAQKKERWLLWLDNAGNSDTSGILGAVCGTAVPGRDDEWILVTSRLGSRAIWNRMKECQNLPCNRYMK